MATPEFYDENRNRTFPFRRLSAGNGTPDSGLFTLQQLPDWVIVDCGFILGPESGFQEDADTVHLARVERISATEIEFEFRCDSASIADKALVFTRHINDPRYRIEFVESDVSDDDYVSVSLSYSFEDATCGEPYWSGYLVTGNMPDLFASIPEGTSILRVSSAETIVEPGLLQNLDRSQVVTINVANADRTRALRPPGCDENQWSFPVGETYVRRVCMQGDIRFRAGYNIAIAGITSQNLIRFSPIAGAGLGQPCQEVKLFPGESPPIGSENGLLGGDFYCNEVFRTINGIPGPDVRIISGPGVSVSAATSTVIIDVDMTDLRACLSQDQSES